MHDSAAPATTTLVASKTHSQWPPSATSLSHELKDEDDVPEGQDASRCSVTANVCGGGYERDGLGEMVFLRARIVRAASDQEGSRKFGRERIEGNEQRQCTVRGCAAAFFLDGLRRG
ncbi:hypothetical protein MRX96_057948 [Rhipicephalus microplus]